MILISVDSVVLVSSLTFSASSSSYFLCIDECSTKNANVYYTIFFYYIKYNTNEVNKYERVSRTKREKKSHNNNNNTLDRNEIDIRNDQRSDCVALCVCRFQTHSATLYVQQNGCGSKFYICFVCVYVWTNVKTSSVHSDIHTDCRAQI